MPKFKNIPSVINYNDTKYRFYWKRRFFKKTKHNWQDIFDYYQNKFVLSVKESYELKQTSTSHPIDLMYCVLWEDRLAYLKVLEGWEKELNETLRT